MVQQHASWNQTRLLWAGAIVVALWLAPGGAPMPSLTPAAGSKAFSFPKIQKATRQWDFSCGLSLKLVHDQPSFLMLHMDRGVCSIQIPHGPSLSLRTHLCWTCPGPEHCLGIIQCWFRAKHTPWHVFGLWQLTLRLWSDMGKATRLRAEEVSAVGTQAGSHCTPSRLASSAGLLHLLV